MGRENMEQVDAIIILTTSYPYGGARSVAVTLDGWTV